MGFCDKSIEVTPSRIDLYTDLRNKIFSAKNFRTYSNYIIRFIVITTNKNNTAISK